MSSAGPWSVKGIDPKAREIAKDLARRSGMTLGEWLNQMIIEGDEALQPPPPEPRRPVLQAGPAFREAPPFRDAPRSRYDEPSEGELNRIAQALDTFSTRLEAAEHRSTLAISGIDQSVMGVLSRMDGIEREQTAVSARFEGALDEVRSGQGKVADRLRRMEQEDGPRIEAMKALEASIGKIAGQIYEGESRARGALSEVRQDLSGISRRIDKLDAEVGGKAEANDPYTAGSVVEAVVARVVERIEQAEGRTSAAVQALETSFAGLDARLKSTETRLTPEVEADTPEARFQKLAAELQEKVEASRAEMAEHMRAAADGKLDRMEAALRDLSGHVESAERQSAQAIDRMGREVMRIAQTLGQRVAAVETRNAEAGEQVGGEMARIADAIENRMRTADAAQAEALEKLGGEIGRIAERLAERIAASERRAATAIDEVGDQVARVTDKINQRYDRAASELSERIKQSEERTAKLLEDARETLDKRLIDTQRRNAIDAAVQAVEAPAARISDFDDGEFSAGEAFPQGDFGGQTPTAGFNDDPFSPPPAPEIPRFDPPRFEAHDDEDDGFIEPAAPPPYSPAGLESTFDDGFGPPPVQSGRNTSTRELIEAARAAARQASATEGRGRRNRPVSDDLAGSAPAPAIEPEARGLGAFLTKRKKKKESTTLRTALLASGTAASLTMALAGYGIWVTSKSNDGAPPPAPPTATASNEGATAQSSDADLLAAALTPEPQAVDAPAPVGTDAKPAATGPAPAAAPAPARPAVIAAAEAPPATVDARAIYSSAVRQIESGDQTGLDPLRRAANLGYAPAQFYLAKLHETGGAGLKKDPVEARRWTERAAAAGDSKAQHNLGLYYFEGTGGAKNTTQAAAWFRKAADAGLKDSQYNLARLYEQGYGVAQNGAEAYKWYLIAAAGGDTEAKSSAERLRQQLPPEQQQAAQRSAGQFRPQTSALAQR